MKIITLNIQGGFKIDQVCQEVKEKIAPFDILCLQEVCESKKIKNHAQQIVKSLGGNYDSISFLPIDFKIKKMGNAFVFNKDTLKLIDSFGFSLPSFKLNFFWRILDNRFKINCDRLCFTGLFQTKKGSKVRVSNLHLDAGNTSIKKKQVQFVLKTLSNVEQTPLEFILGDFNTVSFVKKDFPEFDLLLKKGFKNLSKNISWTASPSNPDPAWKSTYQLILLLRPFHFLLRQKMDHIFTKGKLNQPKCLVLDLSSTDHRAIILNLSP